MSTSNQSCRVWSRIERKRKDGTILKLRFQDAPSSAMGSVIDFLVEHFPRDETFQKAAGVCSNPEAIKEYRQMFELLNTTPVVICCHDNDSEEIGEIIGASIADLFEGELPFDGINIQTKELQLAMNIIMECEKIIEPIMKTFKSCYVGRSMTVHPDYRGLGIASEFVKIRRMLMIDQNIPVSCSLLTAYGSQKAAEKDNWETVLEINSVELGQKLGVVFKDSPPTFKFMLVRNPNCS